MRLLLVRHAEAQRQEAPDAAAPLDLGLTAEGRRQARDLADRLRSTGECVDCAAFLTSPLPRAVETAENLADGLALPKVRKVLALSEIGTLPDTPPTGEALEDFFHRVEAALATLARRHDRESVAAVTHGGFIMASIRVLFDIPTPGTRARFDPDYASLTEWSHDAGVWRLERYNVRGSAR